MVEVSHEAYRISTPAWLEFTTIRQGGSRAGAASSFMRTPIAFAQVTRRLSIRLEIIRLFWFTSGYRTATLEAIKKSQ